jgi:tetratricopeptide (TPR) repeat protein
MQLYSLRDAARVLSLSPATVRSLLRFSRVTPAPVPGGAPRISFQDLVVLRTAGALLAARVPRARIRRALAALRQRLPDLPLSRLCLGALGGEVVVREGVRHWQAESGQYLLSLEVSLQQAAVCTLELRPQPRQPAGEDAAALLVQAGALEAQDPAAALAAYQQAASLDPTLLAAWVNRGHLLHQRGAWQEARCVYQEGLSRCGPAPLLLFNLGCVLEDLDEPQAAITSYQEALAQDPHLAEAHYNLARLYECLGHAQDALRHLSAYRRLARRP